MKMKILFGGIGAVALLVLVSFTNVVNVQSTRSDSITDSPLYSIRTQKAINKESKTILTLNYLGKGFNELSFSLRDNRTTLIRRAIEIIEKMDEKSISTFITMNIGNQRKIISNLEIYNAINQLKRNPDILTNYVDYINDNEPKPFTFAGPGCEWRPGGLLIEIILLFINIIFFILFVLALNILHYYSLAYCYTSQFCPSIDC